MPRMRQRERGSSREAQRETQCERRSAIGTAHSYCAALGPGGVTISKPHREASVLDTALHRPFLNVLSWNRVGHPFPWQSADTTRAGVAGTS